MELASLQSVGFWLIGLGVVGLAAIAWSRGKRAGAALVVMTATLWTVFGLGLMPALDPYSSSARLMQRVGQRIGADAELGMLAWREQNLLQADRPVTDFGFKASWQDQWAKAGPWSRPVSGCCRTVAASCTQKNHRSSCGCRRQPTN